MRESEMNVLELLNQMNENEKVSSKENIDNLCKNIDNMINSFSFQPKNIADAIINSPAKNIFKQISILWVHKLSITQYYDDRNKYSVEIGKKIAELPNIKKSIEYYTEQLLNKNNVFDNCFSNEIIKIAVKNNCSIPETVVEYIARDHRTLQQTFSSLVFYFLFNCGDQETDDLKDFEKEYPKFYSTPMI